MLAYEGNQKTIVITGASSGIGRALAEYYAAPNVVLGLTGRNTERLDGVSKYCQSKGALVYNKSLDVTSKSDMEAWLLDFDARHNIDLLIANAGISGGMGDKNFESSQQTRAIFDVNLNGVLNTVEPLIPVFVERGCGQIAIMSSLAGYRGWPGAPAYCASKAAVKAYGEAIRGCLKKHGVRVSVICPGFVKSNMTNQNNFAMPFIVETHDAARYIAVALEKNRGRITFPLLHALCAWSVMIMPDFLAERLLANTPAKPHSDHNKA